MIAVIEVLSSERRHQSAIAEKPTKVSFCASGVKCTEARVCHHRDKIAMDQTTQDDASLFLYMWHSIGIGAGAEGATVSCTIIHPDILTMY